MRSLKPGAPVGGQLDERPKARFFPVPGGIYIRLGTEMDVALNKVCLEIAGRINRNLAPGWGPAIPAYASVFISVDTERYMLSDVVRRLSEILEESYSNLHGVPGKNAEDGKEGREEGRLHEVPVVYGGEYGPDLHQVAAELGMTEKRVIELHSSKIYRVFCQGFSPGFCFLGPLPDKLFADRLAAPRMRVPAGSVGIAGSQTGIYPLPSPGGWRLIGRTSYPLYRPPEENGHAAPVCIRAGDRVRFYPVMTESFEKTESDRHPPYSRPEHGDKAGAFMEVIHPGLLTTVQDLGRQDWLPYGFTQAGAMDRGALRLANRLLGNDEDEACLECTVVGPTVRFRGEGAAVLTGAHLGAIWQGHELLPEEVFTYREGDILEFRSRKYGMRAYLAVAGGLDVPRLGGSRSTDLTAGVGGWLGRPLRAGDRLPIKPAPGSFPGSGSSPANDSHEQAGGIDRIKREAGNFPQGDTLYVRWIPGPELGILTTAQASLFVTTPWKIGQDSNRMGLRLIGPQIGIGGTGGRMLSEPLTRGAIQLPPGGSPIVLMADYQTIGGYPRIGFVLSGDVDRLSQCVPGQEIRFVPAALNQAWPN